MSAWIDVGGVADIPRLGARVVRVGELRVAVFRTADDAVFALDDRCPHRGGPLSEGIVHGHNVTCPLHNFVIQLDSGVAVAPDEGCVRRHQVKVEGERIWLAIDVAQAA